MKINLQCDLWQIAWRKIYYVYYFDRNFINYNKLLKEIKCHLDLPCVCFEFRA